MKLKGQRSFEDVFRTLKELEALDPALVEYGSVFKKFLYEDENNYLAMLFVGPNSRIKEHEHVTENEEYRDMDSPVRETCFIGYSHCLENESTDKWLVVLAHKYR